MPNVGYFFISICLIPSLSEIMKKISPPGKTMLANAIAGELKLPFFSVTGTELISGFSGESEHNIRSLFRQVNFPFLLFLYVVIRFVHVHKYSTSLLCLKLLCRDSRHQDYRMTKQNTS